MATPLSPNRDEIVRAPTFHADLPAWIPQTPDETMSETAPAAK